MSDLATPMSPASPRSSGKQKIVCESNTQQRIIFSFEILHESYFRAEVKNKIWINI
jgi:hypothetical protein